MPPSPWQWAWRACVIYFALAGMTGVLFRLDLAYAGSLGLHLVNVRHAHSHLMFFGWATPALMLCIERYLSMHSVRHTGGFGMIMWWILGLSALAYVFFLMRGYEPFLVGDRRLPLSVMVSGLHILGWYGFVTFYVRQRRHLEGGMAISAWDAAIVMFVLSTFGAWGLALHGPLGLEEPVWLVGLTQFFLDTFSEGWLVLGVLGLAYAEAGTENTLGRRALYAYAFAIPFVYALAMPTGMIPGMVKVAAKAAGVAAGIALVLHAFNLRSLVRTRPLLWMLPILFLAVKGGGLALVSALPEVWWSELRGLRVLYVHVTLLGFVTLGAAAFGVRVGWVLSPWRVHALGVASVALLAGIVPLTGIWPPSWLGVGTLRVAAWTAVLPPLCGLLLLDFDATKSRDARFGTTNS